MESTKYTRQASAVQIMYMHVAIFRCHHKGMTDKTNPIPENTVNAVLEAVIVRDRVF